MLMVIPSMRQDGQDRTQTHVAAGPLDLGHGADGHATERGGLMNPHSSLGTPGADESPQGCGIQQGLRFRDRYGCYGSGHAWAPFPH